MSDEIDQSLARAEQALEQGRSLRGTGFWRAVNTVRANPDLADRYADRIAAIDRRAFERGVKLRVPAPVGITALALLTAFGVVAIFFARNVAPSGLAPIMLLVALGALILGTHSLAHWIVGRLLGIRFTHVFLGGPPPPRPGVKTDYASYLRATRRSRALMHASGAVVTKIIPFALIPFAPTKWLVYLLVAVGVVQIGTDIVLSTKISDWMKVKRELASGRNS